MRNCSTIDFFIRYVHRSNKSFKKKKNPQITNVYVRLLLYTQKRRNHHFIYIILYIVEKWLITLNIIFFIVCSTNNITSIFYETFHKKNIYRMKHNIRVTKHKSISKRKKNGVGVEFVLLHELFIKVFIISLWKQFQFYS